MARLRLGGTERCLELIHVANVSTGSSARNHDGRTQGVKVTAHCPHWVVRCCRSNRAGAETHLTRVTVQQHVNAYCSAVPAF